MHHQEDIGDHQQVVGIPEGVEARQVVQRRRQLHDAPPERVRGEREGEGHYEDQEDPGPSRDARQQNRPCWLDVVEEGPQLLHELVLGARHQPGEVAEDV